MKREKNIIPQIADMDNLRLAFWKARKGKEGKMEVQKFTKNLDENLLKLRNGILLGNVSLGNYNYFKIFDPKERLICAASFSERVLHHALMNICHPYFEKTLIFDTYATRIDKGIYKALEKAQKAMANYQYVAKLDYRKYFDSISHDVLKIKLSSKIKDKKLLQLFDKIIDSYQVEAGFGLPIGNLTSQYFANFYLSELDHFIKESLGIKDYIRYMDDMLLFSNDREQLKRDIHSIDNCSNKLCLTLKPVILSKNYYGVSFLGYKIYPYQLLLNRTSKQRFIRKYNLYEKLLLDNKMSEKEYQLHIIPLLSFVQHAYTKRLRKKIIEGSNRVNRGGSWNNNARNCRVSNRNGGSPDYRHADHAFRLVAQ